MKVNIFSAQVRSDFTRVVALLSAIATFLLISVNIPDDKRGLVTLMALGFIILLYIAIWIVANLRTSKKLHINNSTLEIKIGDIFKQGGLKVIAFNEYFDTKVDDVLISKDSLNGAYLSKKTSDQIDALDKGIQSDEYLTDNQYENNIARRSGKKQKYNLGSIHVDGDYLLVAFSKFDSKNMAYLTLKDYIACLIRFWEEVDRVYAGRSVSLPLLGSGITRFKDTSLQPQEVLDILIWTFKISKVKFKHPSRATIVVHDSIKDKINLSNIDN